MYLIENKMWDTFRFFIKNRALVELPDTDHISVGVQLSVVMLKKNLGRLQRHASTL
jgi:hypothetical protein